MWEIRSRLVHGGGYETVTDELYTIPTHMEAVLRASLSRAIFDDSFAAHFISKESVNRKFPLPSKVPITTAVDIDRLIALSIGDADLDAGSGDLRAWAADLARRLKSRQ